MSQHCPPEPSSGIQSQTDSTSIGHPEDKPEVLHREACSDSQETDSQETHELSSQVGLETYRTLYEQLPSICFTLTLAGEVQSINAFGIEQLGYYAETIIGQPIIHLIHAHDRSVFQAEFKAFLETADSVRSWECRQLRHNQDFLWVKVTVRIVQELYPRLVLMVCEDITALKRVEQELRRQTQQEKMMGTIAQNIRCSFNLEENLTVTVAQVRQLLQVDRVLIMRFLPEYQCQVIAESVVPGYPAALGQRLSSETLLSQTYRESCHGQYQASSDLESSSLSASLLQALHQLKVKSRLEVPILQHNACWGLLIVHQCRQQRRWEMSEVELMQRIATKIAIAIQQSDLYRQIRRLNNDLERQGQKRTAQLQLAFDFEATLKRITDRVRDSLDEQQILETAVQEVVLGLGVSCCNAALYDLEQGTSTILYEYTTSISPSQGRVSHLAAFPELYGQLLEGQYFQFCSVFPNPIRGHVAMLACPILDDRGVLGDLWLINHMYYAFNEQDIRLVQQVANQCAIAIRQARLYQAAQAQVRELERLNHLKDDFLSTVSHELRTPVTSMRMAIQMLGLSLNQEQNLFAEFDKPKVEQSKTARYFQVLQEECEREIKLISDLLDLQRLESGYQTHHQEVILLQEWLPPIVQPFQEESHEEQQHFHFKVPTDLPAFSFNAASLARILTELLSNACKYTPVGGHIQLLISMNARTLEVQVKNTGEIPAQELPRIFDKFYRIPQADPWKQRGTGLGLALVKRLVTQLGGQVQATSQAGETRLIVEVPIEPCVELNPVKASRLS